MQAARQRAFAASGIRTACAKPIPGKRSRRVTTCLTPEDLEALVMVAAIQNRDRSEVLASITHEFLERQGLLGTRPPIWFQALEYLGGLDDIENRIVGLKKGEHQIVLTVKRRPS